MQNRLGNLRLGINAMKRAYPQWLAAGGESLPLEIQKVVFPLDYWPLLQKHAAARGLDPFLVAALAAQESTFDPAIRSSANAVGLMQVLPSTGRQFARRLKIAGYTAARLTDPETNVRLGTAIFADSIRKFGGVHYALAAYNAGEHRVAAWQRERPGMPQEVFIDDIPFPETQNYVKRILGTAEDYRRLYGKYGACAGPRRRVGDQSRVTQFPAVSALVTSAWLQTRSSGGSSRAVPPSAQRCVPRQRHGRPLARVHHHVGHAECRHLVEDLSRPGTARHRSPRCLKASVSKPL